MMQGSPRSMAGLRVVDVTTNVAGPFATQILGDLGADVIKVERPGSGDDTRDWGPPFWPDGTGVTFSSLNRSKRSIALDLHDAADLEVLRGLIDTADVLVENMRPGAFARLGFTAESMRATNPGLIYARVTGFGSRGSAAARLGYDPLVQAYTGLMAMTGAPGSPVARIPVSILDKGSAMWLVIGILDALRVRERTSAGAEVSTSLFETALTWESNQLAGVLADGTTPRRTGSATGGIAPYQAFETADEPLVVAAGNDRIWRRLCIELGRPELADDSRFTTNADRVRHREELVAVIESVLRTRPAAEWEAAMARSGIPCSVVRGVDAMASDGLLDELGLLVDQGDPADGQVGLSLPLEFDGRRVPVGRRPPGLDEHGADVRALVTPEKDGG
ncbi:CaiB/BaiF CoA transferase family protein [Pseudonocardia oroxyli]|uniref:Crotonobetainyl-CoA:carnitine CoA-transferase CaiB n=1 Tax=Pseudonocardia oroxyli TaxID=366584 RepID=A0A1G7SP58_PSEOR|nr:CoA transferase [Pseudonocardia oroxyli]SDG24682.1 Crotonobetainyl-CoA:carnitine CoA-transferase CaiB [Pseudonocardia oroxyli]